MQEVHQIRHWNVLEAVLYFVLITIKGVFNFSITLKHKEQTNTNKICFELLPLSNVVFLLCGSSPTFISHFYSFSTIFKTFI